MPRSTGVYTKPFPDVADGTTIESAVYNGTISDIEQDLNLPRPIIAGGTGATNARDALVALGGEIAAQQVTNYDMFAFDNGSFYSQPGATGQPVNSNVTGNAVIVANNPGYVNLEATDNNTGITYRRQKVAGVWGAWVEQAPGVAVSDARYVNVTGDTMTGDLTIAKASPSLSLTASGSSQTLNLYGNVGGTQRWLLRLGNGSPEGGGNAGSDFDIHRYGNSGEYLGMGMSINRANGGAYFNNIYGTFNGPVNASSVSVSGTLGVSGLTTLTNLNANGAITTNYVKVNGNGDIFRSRANDYGVIFHNNGGQFYFLFTNNGDPDGSFNSLRPFQINSGTGRVRMGHGLSVDGGTVDVPYPSAAGHAARVDWVSSNYQPAGSYQANLGFTPARQGGGNYMGANTIYIGWDAPAGKVRLQVDAVEMGFILTSNNTGDALTNGRILGAGEVFVQGLPLGWKGIANAVISDFHTDSGFDWATRYYFRYVQGYWSGAWRTFNNG